MVISTFSPHTNQRMVCVQTSAMNKFSEKWEKDQHLTSTDNAYTYSVVKQTIHEATFVSSNKVTKLSGHEKHVLYILQVAGPGNRPPVYFKVTCRMYHAIFHVQHAQTIMLPCCQRQKYISCLVYGLLTYCGNVWYTYNNNYDPI